MKNMITSVTLLQFHDLVKVVLIAPTADQQ